jgi:hypothetical protein
MVKKMAFIALAMAVVLGMVSMASAAQNVANTNQKGSLLIWPKIANDYGFNTYITIANDYYSEVWVKCYWVDKDQNIEDFMFRLTPNQPVWFRAGCGTGDIMTVPPFQGDFGELKCWAVNAAGDQQISFNHLYGNAVVFYEDYTAFEYNAWSFTARGGTLGKEFGTPGKLELTGATGGYDACPQYLVENFIAADDGWYQPALALAPCKQDLRQDRIPTCTKAKFDVWNENETKYTGAHRCIKCWYEGWLSELETPGKPNGFGFGSDKFTYRGLHTWLARFRVTGEASTVCNKKFLTPDTQYAPGSDKCTGGQVKSPLLGVLWHELAGPGGWDYMIGTTPHTAGYDGSGFVLWDVQASHPEAAQK